ncbi:Cyanovirin-N [Hygrophoropsis aurantiaca]|uniref:Cyanovirin-N n=1 Tax=Hygrophoropsis aurantiaca TaxID=72124 RepID=A0ACB7ZRH0_9AGAM|nr:Cyanovirin-N [Hygrophoropsis aurantiaca]
MQFTVVQLITSGLLLFGASATFAANGFANTCTHTSLNTTEPRWLQAVCPYGNGQQRYAGIDLDDCLSYNGNLVCGGSGYSQECYGCELTGSTNLTCRCDYGDSDATKDVDLNTCIGIDAEGELYC